LVIVALGGFWFLLFGLISGSLAVGFFGYNGLLIL
jgi:hypothetical protein